MAMSLLQDITEALLHMAFPHICEGCGSDILPVKASLCAHCFTSLPETNFHFHPANPVERIFWGRLPVACATSLYYFTKESLVQRLMHQFKYRSNKELGYFLGTLMGHSLSASNRFGHVDALVPLPLFPAKEKKRGYNQATVLCEGIAEVMGKPVLNDVVARAVATDTQTKKGRVERWHNINGSFALTRPAAVTGKHLLLVDDVITTGASLEACGRELARVQNTELSIATLCFSAH